MLDLTKGELRQALKQCVEKLEDYIELYNHEYDHSTQLQNRIDRLKVAQREAQLEFRGFVE